MTVTINGVKDQGNVDATVIGSNAEEEEAITIDNTVGGVGFTPASIVGMKKVFLTVETAPIRFRLAGAPTSAVGHLLNPGDTLELDTAEDLASFRAIRTGASSATIYCTYSE